MFLTIYIVSTIISLIGCEINQNKDIVKDIPRKLYWSMAFVPVLNSLLALAAIKDIVNEILR